MNEPHDRPGTKPVPASLERRPRPPRAARADEPPGPGPGFTSFLDAFPDTLVAVDRRWRFTYLNQHTLDALGKKAEELLGRAVWEAYPAFLGPAVESNLRRAMAERTTACFEMCGPATGTWLEVHAYPSPDGLVIHGRDITERKCTEEALRQSEERFLLAAEAVDAMIYEYDLRGGAIFRSPGMVAVIGFQPDEAPATVEWWRSRIHPDDLPDAFFRFETALASEKAFDMEYRVLHRRGDYVHVWDRGRIVRDRMGRAIRIVGCTVSVTERKRAEAALRESEERHRLLSELTSDYTYTCRVEADGIIRLESATAGFTRVTGYTVNEAETRGGWISFIHPADLPDARKRMVPLLAGQRHEDELRIITKSGQTRWIRYSIHPIWDTARNRVVRMLGAAQDITGRKKAEAQLQEYTQRLQALSRRLLEVQEVERRHLARELHDEVGQALTGLKLALESCPAQPGDRLRATLDEAQALVRELTARVRDLSLRLRPTMLDDLGLLPALVWLLQRYTAQTRVEVQFRHSGLGGRFRPEVETAAYRIVQEALTNVARHSGAREAAVQVWLAGEVLCLKVEDRGAGFDPETVHQAGPSGGLSGMQERAVLLGGRLTLEAAAGTGTCLMAELPIHGAEEEPTDDADPAARR